MVDDSAADRKLYRLLLKQEGGEHEFFEASAAGAGLQKVREVAPDCVLLDYRLPDMDGLEFLTRLRSESGTEEPGFAVVMLTGVAGDQFAMRALRAGAHDYLTKDAITAEGLNLAIEKATQKVELIRALREERDRLAHSLGEKEVLVKEVHHRVKNNLQVIASLLRLHADMLEDASAAAELRESQHRVEAMAMIHEQLYESEDLREVDLARHAQLILSNLFTAYGVEPDQIQGTVEANGQALVMGVDRAIPAGLILNELVSNALKHAFPEGRRGAVRIALQRTAEDDGGGRILVTISDDGVGLPQGLDIGKSKSLGLKIVDILTRQLKGSVEMASSAGATFRISFPEK